MYKCIKMSLTNAWIYLYIICLSIYLEHEILLDNTIVLTADEIINSIKQKTLLG